MKPKQIIVIRHGESQANADKSMYAHMQDHLIDLTAKGEQQSLAAGKKLRDTLNGKQVTVWSSPYQRSRRTSELFMSQISAEVRFREDPRIREQDWGNFYSLEDAYIKRQERKKYGYFFYRIPDGESGADVYDRLSTFLDTLYRDFDRDEWSNALVISTHGITALVFLMRFFHWSYEAYEEATAFGNCDYVVLNLDEHSGHYHLSYDSRTAT